MKLGSDFRAAVSKKNRLHHESREHVEERLHQDRSTETMAFIFKHIGVEQV